MILFSERKKSRHIFIHAQKFREYCSGISFQLQHGTRRKNVSKWLEFKHNI